ncbi:MAG: hypothetical protein ABIP48_04235 [Planctomycetota bacterium]
MPQTVYTLDEFRARHGNNSTYVPAYNAHIFGDAAHLIQEVAQLPPEQYEPPENEYAKLRLLVARQSVLVARARDEFMRYRQAAYLNGWENAIDGVKALKKSHDDQFAELERLQSELRSTPEERQRLAQLALARELGQRRLEERGRAQSAIGSIVLCNEDQGQTVNREEN